MTKPHTVKVTSDAWPSSEPPPAPLPRVEDLPVVEQGYDPEAVRRAFDSFYRHAARLDVSLRALEAVDAFRRDADALRSDLRAIRALGVGGQGDPTWAPRTYERAPREVSGTVLRLAFEAALIIAVAVVAGVAHLRPPVIVALMGGVFVVVVLCEWLAARARFAPPPVAYVPDRREPAPYVEAPPPTPGWGPQAVSEDTQPEALTVVGAVAAHDGADPWEERAPEDDPEDEVEESGGISRR